MIFATVVHLEDGPKLRINRPGKLAEDIELSAYNRLQLAAELLASIPYKDMKNDP